MKTNRPNQCSILTLIACLIIFPGTSMAYLVDSAISLEELEEEADLICKVVAIKSKPIESEWFAGFPPYEPTGTELKVVAVYKGEAGGKTIQFQHYSLSPKPAAHMYKPQSYEFKKGRSYLLFAKNTGAKGVFRQLWKNHKSKEDQGLILAASEDENIGPVSENIGPNRDSGRIGRTGGEHSVRDIVWKELTALLGSEQTGDVIYAVRQFDQMSGGARHRRSDFLRGEVFNEFRPLISHADPGIAREVITVLGSDNPYMRTGLAAGLLASLGNGHIPIPGYLKMDLDQVNVTGTRFLKSIAALADSEDRPADLRALAIRSLGRSQNEKIATHAIRWATDPIPEVRAAAIVLMADYPSKIPVSIIKTMSRDDHSAVRVGVAQTIGFAQLENHLPLLQSALGDEDPMVASAAALSLLSFPLDHSREILEENLNHPEFQSVFVNALASENPAPYLRQLARITRNDLRPKKWWGGRYHGPRRISWDILYKHLQKQAEPELKSGGFDEAFDALENMKFFSSSEPRDLYAFYLQRGMNDRAKRFREACKTRNMETSFDRVDQNPGAYQRR